MKVGGVWRPPTYRPYFFDWFWIFFFFFFFFFSRAYHEGGRSLATFNISAVFFWVVLDFFFFFFFFGLVVGPGE